MAFLLGQNMLSVTINRISLALDTESANGCMADVISHVDILHDCYPEFDLWMAKKVVPGISLGDRSMLVEYRRGQLAGFAIIKDDGVEKKLCCLRVLNEFKNTGLGLRLFGRAFDELNTDKPLLSVAEERLQSFQKIFDYYGFELSKEYVGRYRVGRVEYSFNGLLDVPADFSHISYPSPLLNGIS
jgi:hypothetical protein